MRLLVSFKNNLLRRTVIWT